MTAANLINAIRNAPNAAALMRAVDRAAPGNALSIHRVGRSSAWETMDRGQVLLGGRPF